MGKRYVQVMEKRILKLLKLKLLKLTLVLEVAIFGRSNWPFPASHLPCRCLLYRNSEKWCLYRVTRGNYAINLVP